MGLNAFFLQFYNPSDRELEERLRYDLRFIWLSEFSTFERTPDYLFFGRFRNRVDTKQIGKRLKAIVNKTKEKHRIRGVFHFVNATSILTKNIMWLETNKAIRKKKAGLNHNHKKKVSADPKARFGCKEKSEF